MGFESGPNLDGVNETPQEKEYRECMRKFNAISQSGHLDLLCSKLNQDKGLGNLIDELYNKAFPEKVEQLQLLEGLTQLLDEAQGILNQLDQVFIDNSKELFEELIAPEQIKIRELSAKLDEQLKFIDVQLKRLQEQGVDITNSEVFNQLQSVRTKYITILVGIGDEYEGGAKTFLVEEIKGRKVDYGIEYYTDKKFKGTEKAVGLSQAMIDGMSVEQCFDYLKGVHGKIDSNYFQSDNVIQSNSMYTRQLHHQIVEKFKQGPNATENLLRLVDIMADKEGGVDDSQEDQTTANEVLLYLMSQKGGVFDKLQTIKGPDGKKLVGISDPKLEGKNLTEIFQNSKDLKIPGTDINLLQAIGFVGGDDSIDNLSAQRYEDLTYTEKLRLSTLARFQEKYGNKIEGLQGQEEIEQVNKRLDEATLKYEETLNKLKENGIDIAHLGKSLSQLFEGAEINKDNNENGVLSGSLVLSRLDLVIKRLDWIQKDIKPVGEMSDKDKIDLIKDIGQVSQDLQICDKSYRVLSQEMLQQVGIMFGEIGRQAYEDILDGVNTNFEGELSRNNFDGLTTEKIRAMHKGVLTEQELSMIDKLNDINGNGGLEFSDEFLLGLKQTGKISAIVGLTLLSGYGLLVYGGLGMIPLASASAELTTVQIVTTNIVNGTILGMGVGATATISSALINRQGYDYINEGVFDLYTDFGINTALGGLGGLTISALSKESVKLGLKSGISFEITKDNVVNLFSKEGTLIASKKTALLGGVFTSGMLIEKVRQEVVMRRDIPVEDVLGQGFKIAVISQIMAMLITPENALKSQALVLGVRKGMLENSRDILVNRGGGYEAKIGEIEGRIQGLEDRIFQLNETISKLRGTQEIDQQDIDSIIAQRQLLDQEIRQLSIIRQELIDKGATNSIRLQEIGKTISVLEGQIGDINVKIRGYEEGGDSSSTRGGTETTKGKSKPGKGKPNPSAILDGGNGGRVSFAGAVLLQDLLTGFDEDKAEKGELSDGFKGLLGLFKEYSKTGDEQIKEKIVGKMVYELRLHTEMSEEDIRKAVIEGDSENKPLFEQFMEALGTRIQIERGVEGIKMNKIWGNPEIMKALMGKFVEVMSEEDREKAFVDIFKKQKPVLR